MRADKLLAFSRKLSEGLRLLSPTTPVPAGSEATAGEARSASAASDTEAPVAIAAGLYEDYMTRAAFGEFKRLAASRRSRPEPSLTPSVQMSSEMESFYQAKRRRDNELAGRRLSEPETHSSQGTCPACGEEFEIDIRSRIQASVRDD